MAIEKNNFGLCEICLGINSIDSYKCVMENIAKKIVEELDFIDASMIRMSDRTCKKLEIASYCGLSDLSWLSALDHLSVLNLCGNQISDLTGTVEQTALTDLDLSKNLLTEFFFKSFTSV